jgi:hypothetical protein
MSRKKKSIAALGAAIAEREKNSTDQTSAVQQLVEAYLSTNNEAKRAKKIAEIKSRCGGLTGMTFSWTLRRSERTPVPE